MAHLGRQAFIKEVLSYQMWITDTLLHTCSPAQALLKANASMWICQHNPSFRISLTLK